MDIPFKELSPAALLGIIEAFVLQEGTEYGNSDISLDTKVIQVRKQLERGDAIIRYDQESETCGIVLKNSP